MIEGLGISYAQREMGILMLFFFQAEDGIRDYKVTGVQTCALPIYIGDFGPDEPLLVDHMVEPIIMGPRGLIDRKSVV